MGLEQYMGGKVSPIENEKKDIFGAPAGEKDITPEEAKAATAEAARKSLEDEVNKKKSPEEIKAEINDILKNL